MPIDPIASAVESLATYFGALSGIASAIRGWPEHNVSLDLTAGPVISIDPDENLAQRIELAPSCVNDAPPFLYRYAWLSITVQLDLWAAYRAQRDDVGATVERAFHNQLQFGRSGLFLAQSDYYERPLTITASDAKAVDESRAAAEGVWRQTWMLSILTDLVGQTTTPATSELVVRDGDGDHSIT